MQCNIGKIDRAIRGIAGTVIVGWCLPYSLFGINTGCKSKREEQDTLSV
ncbi:MAG: DUF2892 domain-containing protein [Sulfurimonas sp.]